jgi:hypothetical protein
VSKLRITKALLISILGLGNTERAERHLDRAAAWLGTIDDELAK